VAKYIQFTDDDGATVLVETDEQEGLSSGGIEKSGLKEAIGDAAEQVVVAARTRFEQAVGTAIQSNTRAFLHAVRHLPQQDQPESLEVTFALKATGQVGNTAVALGTAEANYTVKITWKR
jgi:hypothetical protein